MHRFAARVGANWSMRAKLLVNAMVALLPMLCMLVAIFNSAQDSYQQEQQVSHTYQVLTAADNLLLHLLTMQTSARGYLLTGEQQILAPYDQALHDYRRSLQELKSLVSDNPVQSERLIRIHQAAQDWRVQVIERALQIQAQTDGRTRSEEAIAVIAGGANRFNTIRAQLEAFQHHERDLLAERTARSQQAVAALQRMVLWGVPVAASFSLVVALLIASGTAWRVEQVARAAARMEVDQFDDSVELPAGDDEVGRMARAFQRMAATIREQIVARQITEELLREREERFRLLAEHATDLIARYAPDGTFLYASPASETILGYAPERLIGRSVVELIHPEDLPAVRACHESLRQGATEQTVVYRLRTVAGDYVWVETTSHALRDSATGAIVELQAASRNISKRKQIEDALAQQHAFFRQVVGAMGQGLTVTDSAGRFEFVNEAYARMLGMEPADLIGLSPRDVTLPDDHDVLNRAQAQRAYGVVSTYETRLRRADGSAVYALVTGVPRKQDGVIAGSIAVITDLTERRKIEEALRRERDFISVILDTISSLVIVLDRQGRIARFNRACEHLSGYRCAEVEGRYVWDLLLPAEECAPVQAVFAQLVAGQFPNQYENDWITRSGARRRIAWFNTAILGEDGQPAYIIGTGSDITDRKATEAQLASYNAQLSSKVAELQRHADELRQLNELSDLLQACRSAEEAYNVMVGAMQQLFAGDSGALAIFKASQNFLEVVASWGDAPRDLVFRPDECWGLRRGRVHLVQPGSDIRCAHSDAQATSSCLCVPMMANGESLGVLQILHGAPEPFPEAKQRLAQAVAGQFELALASLRLQETLRNQSIRDPLTGLFNRRYMEESLEREVHRAVRNGYPLAILMLDVDHFKRFNDTFGHDAGDALLREVGQLLQSQIRGDDIACRYGGEEFTIVLVNVTPEIAQRRAEALRQAVKRLQVRHLRQALGPISISIGIAHCPEHGREVAPLLRRADAALYRAKHEGRDRVIVAM